MGIADIGQCTAIVVICYLVGMACKTSEKIKDSLIPVIVGTVGGMIGAVALYVIPEFPAGDVITAIAVGIASGLTAVGANQVFKQSTK